MICSIKVLLCQDSQQIGQKSAGTGHRDIKPVRPAEPVLSRAGLVAPGEGKLLHCSNSFRESGDRLDYKDLQESIFRGLRPACWPACLEWIERKRSEVSGYLKDVRVSGKGVFQAAEIASGG